MDAKELIQRPRTRANLLLLKALFSNPPNFLSWADLPIPRISRTKAKAKLSQEVLPTPPFSPMTPSFVFAPGIKFLDDDEVPELDIGEKLTPVEPIYTHLTIKRRNEVMHWSIKDLDQKVMMPKKDESKRKCEMDGDGKLKRRKL